MPEDAADTMPPWLTHELLGKMLGRPVKAVTGEALAPGNGFASSIARVSVTLDQGDVKHIIVKRPPDPKLNDLYPFRETFDVEARVYAEILPLFHELLKMAGGRDKPPLGPRMLHRIPEPNPTLYFEDISGQGFRIVSRDSGLDVDHVRLVYRTIARWHAAGAVLLQRQPELFKNMPRMVCAEHANIVDNFLCRGFGRFLRIAEQWPDELSKRVVAKLKRLAVDGRQRILDANRPKPLGQGFNVSLHGDLWTGNILFRYNPDGKPAEVRLIDFQLSTWGSLAVDLLYFQATQGGTARAQREQLLAEYHDELSYCLRALGAAHVPTLSEIKDEVKRRIFVEVIHVGAGKALMMAPTSLGLTMSAMLGEFSGEGPNPAEVAYGLEPFQREMKEYFAIWEREGMLDELLA